MNQFSYVSVASQESACTQCAASADAAFIAGGTNLLDLMKEGVARPGQLIDINALDPGGHHAHAGRRPDAGRAGAQCRYRLPPAGTRTLSAADGIDPRRRVGADPQNMASNGGNLLQRTRCVYFYDLATPCNKREPGTGCSAIGGLTRNHAILGASVHCIATHPSDMCVALAALEAIVHVRSGNGVRQIPFADFHRLPGAAPQQDHMLLQGELITHIELPPAQGFAAHSVYLKLRDRLSYAFALVSVAAALDLAPDGTVRAPRIALGGVAHKPWRRPEAEAALLGAKPDATSFARAAGILLAGARGQGQNDFKIAMAQRAVVRALRVAHAGTVTNTGDNARARKGTAP